MTTSRKNIDGQHLPCPCCGSLTLDQRAQFEICNICEWEDNGQDEADSDTVRGGPNGNLSLTRARQKHSPVRHLSARAHPFLNRLEAMGLLASYSSPGVGWGSAGGA